MQNTASSLPVEVSDILSGIENLKNASRGDGSGEKGAFMKFTKGVYSYGSDGIEPEEGSKWAVNPRSFLHGFQCWGPGKLLGEEIANMGGAPINKNGLAVHTFIDPEEEDETKAEKVAPWKPYRAFELVCTNGEDKGQACILGSTSKGMITAVNGLITDLAKHLKDDAGTPVAVIELNGDSYKHTTWGKTHIPVFEILEWVSMDAVTVSDSDDEPEDEAPEPAKPKRKRSAKAEDDGPGDEGEGEGEEPEPAKPKRQRRRRVSE